MNEETTLIRNGNFKLTPGTEVIIPESIGRGPWSVKLYRALRVVRRFRSDVGMSLCEVEVEPVN